MGLTFINSPVREIHSHDSQILQSLVHVVMSLLSLSVVPLSEHNSVVRVAYVLKRCDE